MGGYAPYISLQLQKPDGGWTYNYGGVINSRAVAGGDYVLDFRDIVIPGDATMVRASFCVWEAAPGTVSAMDFKFRAVY
jgi:hypothetical protein